MVEFAVTFKVLYVGYSREQSSFENMLQDYLKAKEKSVYKLNLTELTKKPSWNKKFVRTFNLDRKQKLIRLRLLFLCVKLLNF